MGIMKLFVLVVCTLLFFGCSSESDPEDSATHSENPNVQQPPSEDRETDDNPGEETDEISGEELNNPPPREENADESGVDEGSHAQDGSHPVENSDETSESDSKEEEEDDSSSSQEESNSNDRLAYLVIT
jgi:type IV secretory pathway VirB10-like protein